MSELTVDSFLLVRAPAYSFENFNEGFLKEALATDFFRAALYFASQDFFKELSRKDFDYEQFGTQAKITLWKYLNRMCFRPLPYGMFSSYSVAEWADVRPVFKRRQEIIVRPDFKAAADYIRSLNPADFSQVKYYTNNSIYKSGQQLRFISQAYSAQNKFAIVEIKVVPGLIKLLKFIKNGRTKTEIVDFLVNIHGDQELVTAYFDSLLSGEVIVSALTPNVTGPDYSGRCRALLSADPLCDQNRLRFLKVTLEGQRCPLPVLKEYIGQQSISGIENPAYTVYERKITGGINQEIQDKLLSLVRNMDKLTTNQDHMKTFKADFIKKYDQQEVPLMEVLDPGTGIGYENLVSGFDPQAEDYISDLREIEEKQKVTGWGRVEQMIFKKWNDLQYSGRDRIVIDIADMAQLAESKAQLPPGFFVLFKVIDDQIWMDNIGGVSGIELSSRFGGTGTEIEAGLQNICRREMAVNNDYIFAEIAFSPNDRASNINQRGHFYPYEIPVLTHCTRPDEFTIRLSDLMVSVRDGRICLRSARLNKYIIPRLSSAYNYQLSSIAAFRFLCDLQFQGVKSNLSFSLVRMFPGMDHYPRVEMNDVVISPATWILNAQQLEKITGGDDSFLKAFSLPDYFCLQEGDNFLVFNSGNKDNLSVFRKCMKNKKSITLTEFILTRKPGLSDADGKPFNAQLIACILNGAASYAPVIPLMADTQKNTKIKRAFLPAEGWLYLKLYTHYSLTDELLVKLITPVIKRYKKDNPGFKWFFIRYQDPGHHLRLRFFSSTKSSYILLEDLMQKLKPWVDSGKIADVLLDCYKREIEKYSALLINEVESFFYADSEYILSIFGSNKKGISFKLSFAVNSSLKMIGCFIPEKESRMDFLTFVLDNAAAEFNRSKEVIHKLDLKYRKFQKELINDQETVSQSRNHADQLILEIAAKTTRWNKKDRYNLLINLVHMHMNRIFEQQPREYECVAYHFMKKHQLYLNYMAIDVS